MPAAAVIAVQPAEEGRPVVTYRPAGDHHVLIEYGDEAVDLRLSFFALAVLGRLAESAPPGVVEAAPGLRSVLVSFAPERIGRAELIDRLWALHERAAEPAAGIIPSRLITLPIAFDDSMSAKAVRRYIATLRADAPNIRDGNNIDYIVRCNGLADREALYSSILDTEWWSAFIGFQPGLPFLFPLDPRHELSVPKYNPTRAWTADGAVGIGGPCVAIYPTESQGSFQLFGRTLPIYDVSRRHSAFAEDSNLVRPGDRVRFTRVTEDELLELRREVFEDRYEYRIEDAEFVVADYLAQRARQADSAEAARARRAEAAQRTEVP